MTVCACHCFWVLNMYGLVVFFWSSWMSALLISPWFHDTGSLLHVLSIHNPTTLFLVEYLLRKHSYGFCMPSVSFTLLFYKIHVMCQGSYPIIWFRIPSPHGVDGYHSCLTHRRSQVRVLLVTAQIFVFLPLQKVLFSPFTSLDNS